MAAQTVMVRRVVVGPGVVVAGGVDASRKSALTSRHCEIDTTLAPLKKKELHNALEFTLYCTNNTNTEIWTASASRPYVPVCGCELRFGVLFASPRKRGALSVSRQKTSCVCVGEREKEKGSTKERE